MRNKTQTIYIDSLDPNRSHCIKQAFDALHELDVQRDYEVIIREPKTSRSLRQLGGLFGNWIDHIAQATGNDHEYVHRMLKAKCLARLYVEEPLNDLQEQWVELLYRYQQEGDQSALTKHAKRISLSWITTAEQMSQYMERVEIYCASKDIFLPPMDKSHKRRKVA